jgi:lipopolysaccharide/colanic/teichoic acid biosynthesis glycosyltransferase
LVASSANVSWDLFLMSEGALAPSGAGTARSEGRLGLQPRRVFATGQAFVALIILVLLIPLITIICIAIWLQDGGPILFGHQRIGQGGRSFTCLKFRTMAKDAEARLAALLADDPDARAEWALDFKLRRDPRVTPLGDLLRRSSLDELPQLLNVIRGEMSLVGPRPIVLAETPRYGWRIRQYSAVKPGITGLWQVSGRSDVSYRRRVAMDCLYVRRKTVLLDCWLLVLTVPAVLLRRGSC